MTESKAPERIWVWPGEDRDWYAGYCSYEPSMMGLDVQYTRTDTLAARDRAVHNAAIEAANDRLAQRFVIYSDNGQSLKAKGVAEAMEEVEALRKGDDDGSA